MDKIAGERLGMGKHRYSIGSRNFTLDPELLTVNTHGALPQEEKVSLCFCDSPDQVLVISLNVAQRCNFNCTYCYADQGTYGNESSMCLETARQSIDWLIHYSGKRRHLGVTFFGGEPLIEFPLIKKIVEYTREKQSKHALKFWYSITTNGSLLSDEVISFLVSNEFRVVISIDGPATLQNSQRPLANGKGSADLVFPKVRKLLASHLHVSCRATIISEANRELVECFLESFGFKEIIIALASHPLSRLKREEPTEKPVHMDETRWQSDNEELNNYLKLVKRREGETLRSKKIPAHLYRHIYTLLSGIKRINFCGAGRSYVGISCTGQVYLCHRFVGHEAFALGHVSRNPDLKSLETLKEEFSAPQTPSKCLTCFARNFCGGGCYHNNLGKTGSPFEQAEEECAQIRKCVELAGGFVASLDEGDKRYLISNNIIVTKLCPLDL